MALYGETTYERQGNTLLVKISLPGIETVTVYQAVAVIENRTNCYCCTCPEVGGSDIHCRNHGFVGERPCDIHDMPGAVDEDDKMPASVKTIRAQQEKESKR